MIERFGLDADFIDQHGLTWIDNLETGGGGGLDDPRHPDHRKPYVQDYLGRHGVRKCEANALVVRPREGRQLCRQAIEEFLPACTVERYDARLYAVREELRIAVETRLAGL